MRFGRVFAVFALVVLSALVRAGALAQSQESATIIVRVTSATNDAPIDNAHVFLLGGDMPQSSLTNAQGILVFSVAPALYRVQVKADGYADSASTEVDVAEGQRLDVSVTMQLAHDRQRCFPAERRGLDGYHR